MIFCHPFRIKEKRMLHFTLRRWSVQNLDFADSEKQLVPPSLVQQQILVAGDFLPLVHFKTM